MAINGSTTPTIDVDQYNGRMTSFVILSCMVASMGGVIFGYDIGISGGITSMEPFLKEFFPSTMANMRNVTTSRTTTNSCRLMINSRMLTTFTSSLYIVAMLASLAAAPITQRYGWRATMMVGGAACIAGAGVGGGAMCVWMLILGRVFLGVGIGFANQVVPVYLTEMALPQHRGAFICGFQLSHAVGFILASLINFVLRNTTSSYAWRLPLSLAAVPSSFLTLAAVFLPDTPVTLLHTGNNLQKAVGMLQRIRGTTDVLTELNDIASTTNPINPYQLIVQTKYRPHLVIAIAVPFFAHVTGFNFLASYTPIMLRALGFRETAPLVSAVALGLLGLCANIVAMVAVDRLGRRALFVIGGAQMLLAHVMIGGTVAMVGMEFREYVYFMLVMMGVFVTGFQLSWGPLGWLVPCEVMPLEIRSLGQSVSQAVQFLVAFASAQILVGQMVCCCKVGMFFVFGALIVVMSGFVGFMLPEMKRVPTEQMEGVWRRNWFWGRRMHDTNG